MSPEVKGGRTPLLFAAKLHLVSAFHLAGAVGGGDPPSLVETMHRTATINVFLAVAFFGLWMGAKAKPLAASVTGFVLLIVAQIFNCILNPAMLVESVAALITLGFLIRSIRAAKAAREWEKQPT